MDGSRPPPPFTPPPPPTPPADSCGRLTCLFLLSIAITSPLAGACAAAMLTGASERRGRGWGASPRFRSARLLSAFGGGGKLAASPWVNFCNKLLLWEQRCRVSARRPRTRLTVASRIDLSRRGGTSAASSFPSSAPPSLHPSITITQTHYRHQSWSRAAPPDKPAAAAAPLQVLGRNVEVKAGGGDS